MHRLSVVSDALGRIFDLALLSARTHHNTSNRIEIILRNLFSLRELDENGDRRFAFSDVP